MPWLTAWARLVVDDATAIDVANQAIARAASGRKALKPLELRLAARAETARLLARGAAAVPSHDSASGHAGTTAGTTAGAHTHDPAAFAPPTPGGDSKSADAGTGEQGSDHTATSAAEDSLTREGTPPRPDPREQTAQGRLAIALEALAPYERLACVTYFVDGSGTDAVASVLGVTRERAVAILEHAAPALARATGENELPDFAAAVDEVEVVNR